MSAEQENTPPQEIVIVRRRGGGEDEGHHGGAWKIAFADFMTAMMAFFLVMWLINATDEKTLTQIASYFNPVKLTDRVAYPKGVRDADGAGQAKHEAAPSASKEKKEKKDKKAAKEKPRQSSDPRDDTGKEVSDATLFIDPQAVLEKLAQQAANLRLADGSEPSQSYRDPFGAVTASPPATPAELAARPQAAPPAQDKPAETKSDAAQTAELAAEIANALAAAGVPSVKGVEVTIADEGILISLTDELDFGMFAVGSAVPVPRLVVALEQIGRILAERPGPIHLRGHTDNRQFRSGNYDNWQLSAARAQIAYHMLLRGGLAEQRIHRVEAYADRSPRIAVRPEAAQNRRIEILIRRALAAPHTGGRSSH